MALTVPAIAAVTLGTTTTTVYTVSNTAGYFYVVRSIIITNVTASAITVSMARVASGGSEADTNRFLKDVPIAAKTALFVNDVITLGPNESIRGLASAGSAATVTLSGFGKLS